MLIEVHDIPLLCVAPEHATDLQYDVSDDSDAQMYVSSATITVSMQHVAGVIAIPGIASFPTHEFRQSLQWTIPGTDNELWAFLKIEENVLPEDREFDFQVPQQHQLVLRNQDQRYTLRPGDEIELPGGVLRYRKLATWMGYKVDYDWTRPWLLATALIGLAGLFGHFVIKFKLLEKKPTDSAVHDAQTS